MSPNKKGIESYQHGGAVLERSTSEEDEAQMVQNEYVLNVAFWTFLVFTIAEAFFAVVAGSQSMLEDAEAMSVDALTYLFNLWAEKVKHRPYSEKELRMSRGLRNLHRERLRLYMELVPPLISVVTLILVTAYALRDAFESLNDPEDQEDDVDVTLMMIFSILNMLLDFVNVTCFARAHQAFGISEMAKEHMSVRDVHNSLELEGLIPKGGQNFNEESENSEESEEKDTLNLNMCSAWTHVIADTLRSVAVLVAASIAFFFESVSGVAADSYAAIVVSIIILLSLLPLIHGLFVTGKKIIALQADYKLMSEGL